MPAATSVARIRGYDQRGDRRSPSSKRTARCPRGLGKSIVDADRGWWLRCASGAGPGWRFSGRAEHRDSRLPRGAVRSLGDPRSMTPDQPPRGRRRPGLSGRLGASGGRGHRGASSTAPAARAPSTAGIASTGQRLAVRRRPRPSTRWLRRQDGQDRPRRRRARRARPARQGRPRSRRHGHRPSRLYDAGPRRTARVEQPEPRGAGVGRSTSCTCSASRSPGPVGAGLFEPLNDRTSTTRRRRRPTTTSRTSRPGQLEYCGYFDVENGQFGGDHAVPHPGHPQRLGDRCSTARTCSTRPASQSPTTWDGLPRGGRGAARRTTCRAAP